MDSTRWIASWDAGKRIGPADVRVERRTREIRSWDDLDDLPAGVDSFHLSRLGTALDADTGGRVTEHAVALIREYHPGVPGYIHIPYCICGWRDGVGWTDEGSAEKRARRHERLAADPHTEDGPDE